MAILGRIKRIKPLYRKTRQLYSTPDEVYWLRQMVRIKMTCNGGERTCGVTLLTPVNNRHAHIAEDVIGVAILDKLLQGVRGSGGIRGDQSDEHLQGIRVIDALQAGRGRLDIQLQMAN